MKFLSKRVVAVSLALAGVMSAPAFAAIDVAGPIATITTDGTAAVTAVGGALLALVAIVMIFRMVKGFIGR